MLFDTGQRLGPHARLAHPVHHCGPLEVADLACVPADLADVLAGRDRPLPRVIQFREAAGIERPRAERTRQLLALLKTDAADEEGNIELLQPVHLMCAEEELHSSLLPGVEESALHRRLRYLDELLSSRHAPEPAGVHARPEGQLEHVGHARNSVALEEVTLRLTHGLSHEWPILPADRGELLLHPLALQHPAVVGAGVFEHVDDACLAHRVIRRHWQHADELAEGGLVLTRAEALTQAAERVSVLELESDGRVSLHALGCPESVNSVPGREVVQVRPDALVRKRGIDKHAGDPRQANRTLTCQRLAVANDWICGSEFAGHDSSPKRVVTGNSIRRGVGYSRTIWPSSLMPRSV